MSALYLKGKLQMISGWLESFASRFGFIRVTRDRIPLRFSFSCDDLTKAVIFKVLDKATGDSPEKSLEFLEDVAGRIVSDLRGLESMSLHEIIRSTQEPILAERQMAFVNACGIACHWEHHVKGFAEKLGIEVFEKTASRKQKSPGYLPLEQIISGVKTKIPRIELSLSRTATIRDSLVHGNFHQLKTAVSESQTKETRKSFVGSAVRIDLRNGAIMDPVMLSEVKDLAEIKKHGSFSWFLDTASSQLFERSTSELRARVLDIVFLKELHALSFEETEHVFREVAIEGKKFDESNIKDFYEKRKIFFRDEMHAHILFDRIHKMIK